MERNEAFIWFALGYVVCGLIDAFLAWAVRQSYTARVLDYSKNGAGSSEAIHRVKEYVEDE